MQEGQRHPVQAKGGGGTTGPYVYEAEPGIARLDKLLPNRQYEGVAERRFRPVDAPQSASSDTQTVEEAKDDLQEFDAAERQVEVRNVR